MRVADHDRFTTGAAHGLGRTPKTARCGDAAFLERGKDVR